MTDSRSTPPSEEPQEPPLPERPVLPEPPEAHFEPPPMRQPKPPREAQTIRTVGLAATIGVMLVAPIVLGALLGIWLDQRLNTSPTFTLILLLLGVGAGFVQMIRILQKIEQEEKRR